jgi:hypothetical protein
MAFRFSEDATITPISLANAVAGATGNINTRNTNVESIWVDMAEYDRIYAEVRCDASTWNGSDGLTTLKLQQATSSAGAGAKDLTTSGAGLNYNTTNDTLTAALSTAIIEARAADMDVANGFNYVRLYAASTGNTGADNLFGVLIRYNVAHRRSQLAGAYVAATQVYISPQQNSS